MKIRITKYSAYYGFEIEDKEKYSNKIIFGLSPDELDKFMDLVSTKGSWTTVEWDSKIP